MFLPPRTGLAKTSQAVKGCRGPIKSRRTAQEIIDRLLKAAGWHVVDRDQVNIHAARDVAVREFTVIADWVTSLANISTE